MLIKVVGSSNFEKKDLLEISTYDGSVKVANAYYAKRQTRFGDRFLDALIIGGVSTKPEYRRLGCVREMMKVLLDKDKCEEYAVSFMHPFSFAYYRKFGYEKVTDHRIINFPLTAIAYLPRQCNLLPVDNIDRYNDVIEIYNKFSINRNIMFKRDNVNLLPTINPEQQLYIWYNSEGIPAAYIDFETTKELMVNHYENGILSVNEMAFLSKEGLLALLGFMRMFDGELEFVKIKNASMFPEIDFVLKNYTHTKYKLLPDIAGRIMNIEKLLKANSYPEEKGRFILKVADFLPINNGVFKIEYQNKEAQIERLSDEADYDIGAQVSSLMPILYGYDYYNASNVAYLDGVTLKNSATDFFRAFSKRNNGVFEHF